MSNSTLGYHSVEKWVKLVLYVERNVPRPDPNNYQSRIAYLHNIALAALEMGFSLRAGDRVYGLMRVINDLAQDDTMREFAWEHRDTWMTDPGQRPKRRLNV